MIFKELFHINTFNPKNSSYSKCNEEPIHIPGSIQSHGYLVVLSLKGKIQRISKNLCDDLNMSEKDFFSFNHPLSLKKICDICKNLKENNSSSSIFINEKEYLITKIPSQSEIIFDIEPLIAINNQIEKYDLLYKNIKILCNLSDIQSICDHLSYSFYTLFEFQRVVIYQFNRDLSGVVVAEAKNESLESFLHLRYPASDIPNQAHALYKKNITRLIYDVDYISSPIISVPGLNNLDLTYSNLRSISPFHIKYMKNMGVTSAFSVSIIIDGQLWGLVSCHMYTGTKYLTKNMKENAQTLTSIASTMIKSLNDRKKINIFFKQNKVINSILNQLSENEDLFQTLSRFQEDIFQITQSHGMALIFKDEIKCLGKTISPKYIAELLLWLSEQSQNEKIFYTDNLPVLYKPAKIYKHIACGILVVRQSIILESTPLTPIIIWFKPEKLSTLNWAGDPNEKIKLKKNDLSPRSSFEKWQEIMHLKSDPWETEEIQAAEKIIEAYHLKYTITKQEERIYEVIRNVALQQGKIETASGVLHDIGNALSALSIRVSLQISTPKWEETVKLIQLKSFFLSHKLILDKVLTENKVDLLLEFLEVTIQSLTTKEYELRKDYQYLSMSVGHIEQILVVQRQNSINGGFYLISEISLITLLTQAVEIAKDLCAPSIIELNLKQLHGILLSVDYTNFIRVIINLIKNAAESIEKTFRLDGKINISIAFFTESLLDILIEDNGIGFENNLIHTSIISPTFNKKTKSGLGLKSCHEMLSAFNGKISIKSPGIDKGATVTIRIPYTNKKEVI